MTKHPLIEIDRCGTQLDVDALRYLDIKLAEYDLHGVRYVDVLIRRLPTDPVRDRREFLAHKEHERNEAEQAGCIWCEGGPPL